MLITEPASWGMYLSSHDIPIETTQHTVLPYANPPCKSSFVKGDIELLGLQLQWDCPVLRCRDAKQCSGGMFSLWEEGKGQRREGDTHLLPGVSQGGCGVTQHCVPADSGVTGNYCGELPQPREVTSCKSHHSVC